jgi:hypothetical protein
MPEFIYGNRDGENGANDTYQICRIHVTEGRYDQEGLLGLHPRSRPIDVSRGRPWRCCPAQLEPGPGRDAPLGKVFAADLADTRERPLHFAELVREEAPNGGRRFTLCRLGVPRETLVAEVQAGLHPDYHTVRIGGEAYVRANPDVARTNNVNRVGRPWSCGGVCSIPSEAAPAGRAACRT